MAGRLLVAGLSVLDHVHRVDTLPEGGAKHRSHGFDTVGGGCAASAAVGAVRLGGAVALLTRLGADPAGDALLALLQAQGLTVAAARGGRQAVSSVMVDAAGERMIVNFGGADLAEAVPPLPPFDAVLTDCRWAVAAEAVLRAARDAGRPGVIDGEKHVLEALARLASHVVFSAPGLRDFAGLDDLDAALAETAARLPGRVAYTDGPHGVVWAGGPHLPAPVVRAVDTLGAGDLWHGAFALALARGEGLDDASRFANLAAAVRCARAGGWEVWPTAAELEDA